MCLLLKIIWPRPGIMMTTKLIRFDTVRYLCDSGNSYFIEFTNRRKINVTHCILLKIDGLKNISFPEKERVTFEFESTLKASCFSEKITSKCNILANQFKQSLNERVLTIESTAPKLDILRCIAQFPFIQGLTTDENGTEFVILNSAASIQQ